MFIINMNECYIFFKHILFFEAILKIKIGSRKWSRNFVGRGRIIPCRVLYPINRAQTRVYTKKNYTRCINQPTLGWLFDSWSSSSLLRNIAGSEKHSTLGKKIFKRFDEFIIYYCVWIPQPNLPSISLLIIKLIFLDMKFRFIFYFIYFYIFIILL